MENLALNKSATASNITYPYTPSKAVNGVVSPFSRWQSNTVPCWLCVDIGKTSLANRWVVRHLPVAGWPAINFVNTEYLLQASLDGMTWFDVDLVQSNTASSTDRTFEACKARFFRIFIKKGLKANSEVASIVELEIYQAPED